jgi:hypothetical protein
MSRRPRVAQAPLVRDAVGPAAAAHASNIFQRGAVQRCYRTAALVPPR